MIVGEKTCGTEDILNSPVVIKGEAGKPWVIKFQSDSEDEYRGAWARLFTTGEFITELFTDLLDEILPPITRMPKPWFTIKMRTKRQCMKIKTCIESV